MEDERVLGSVGAGVHVTVHYDRLFTTVSVKMTDSEKV